VNSLYPFGLKEFPMPGGVPVWHRNLEDYDLNSLFGCIKAYVVCPNTIKRPFLPYRDKNKTLIFPTGEFIGVYYSEDLKYARDLRYTVISSDSKCGFGRDCSFVPDREKSLKCGNLVPYRG